MLTGQGTGREIDSNCGQMEENIDRPGTRLCIDLVYRFNLGIHSGVKARDCFS